MLPECARTTSRPRPRNSSAICKDGSDLACALVVTTERGDAKLDCLDTLERAVLVDESVEVSQSELAVDEEDRSHPQSIGRCDCVSGQGDIQPRRTWVSDGEVRRDEDGRVLPLGVEHLVHELAPRTRIRPQLLEVDRRPRREVVETVGLEPDVGKALGRRIDEDFDADRLGFIDGPALKDAFVTSTEMASTPAGRRPRKSSTFL